MKKSPESSGRISDHAHGLGSVTGEMVTQRARELAFINGRDGKVTEEDWLQAKDELSGFQGPDELPAEEPIADLTQWDETPATTGHLVENSPSSDDETDAERLIHEGMEEANHDRMLKGSQSNSTED